MYLQYSEMATVLWCIVPAIVQWQGQSTPTSTGLNSRTDARVVTNVNGQMDPCMQVCMHKWTNSRVDTRVITNVDQLTDPCMQGCMHGWTDGKLDPWGRWDKRLQQFYIIKQEYPFLQRSEIFLYWSAVLSLCFESCLNCQSLLSAAQLCKIINSKSSCLTCKMHVEFEAEYQMSFYI